MGFAWLSHPTDELLSRWRKDEDSLHQEGHWLYKVLQLRDTVYLGPGTIHLVFRLPKGTSTLAASGNLLRRSDVVEWLQVLSKRVEDAVHQDSETSKLLDVFLHLPDALQRLMPPTRTHQRSTADSDLRLGVASN